MTKKILSFLGGFINQCLTDIGQVLSKKPNEASVMEKTREILKSLLKLIVVGVMVLGMVAGAIIGAIILLGKIIDGIAHFIEVHADSLFIIAGIVIGCVLFCQWVKKIFGKASVTIPDNLDDVEYERHKAKEFYGAISQAVFELFLTMTKVFSLTPPSRLDKILCSPDAIKNGGIWHYQFMLPICKGTVDLIAGCS